MNRPSISAIEQAVCEHMKVTVDDLRGRSRERRFVRPRQIAMALAVDLGGKPLLHVGRHFDRDHTTVINARERVAKGIGDSAHFAKLVETISGSIGQFGWRKNSKMELEACRSIADGIRSGFAPIAPVPFTASMDGITYWDLRRAQGRPCAR